MGLSVPFMRALLREKGPSSVPTMEKEYYPVVPLLNGEPLLTIFSALLALNKREEGNPLEYALHIGQTYRHLRT